MLNAVSRNAGSSPRLLWAIDGPTPTSENIMSPTVTTDTSAMRPKASGKSSRVRIRFDASRMACDPP